MIEQVFSPTTLSAAVLLSIPYILAALGGVSSERTGVVNIALEGILITGAFAAAAVTATTGSPWLGLVAATVLGVAAAAIHAVVSITFGCDQIISGLGVNLLAAGATNLGAHLIWGKPHSDPVTALPWLWRPGPEASGWQSLLHTLTGQPIVLLTALLVVAMTLLHTRTVLGLRLRATGESPQAIDSLGLSVKGLRYTGVLLSGALAGLGGAWLTFNVGQFSEGLSAGKGYIAMAAVVFGRWHPVGATLGCLVFGLSGALAEALERSGAGLPSELVGTLPYVLTVVVLVGVVGRARAPAAIGRPFAKEAA